MRKYMLIHRHGATACQSLHEACSRTGSPVEAGPGGCARADHTIWWVVRASDSRQALAQLPAALAERATPLLVEEPATRTGAPVAR
jgi:hypothetical protein